MPNLLSQYNTQKSNQYPSEKIEKLDIESLIYDHESQKK